MKESHFRSITKSIFWRSFGILILAIITYAYTGSWFITTWVTVLHHTVFLVVFYLHERFYQHVDFTGLKRSIIKCITYETILGTFILGTITLIITGDVQKMAAITLTYIGIKHFLFVIHDLIWERIKDES